MSGGAHVSGFPEWLPEEKMVEDGLVRIIRETYESYGYAPVETCAVERLEVLLAKGSDDKEIYAVKRHVEADGGGQAEIGLHFDLTVPFARYVSQHRANLTFPFKRYQIQKCWRGERPQEGRFREFLQADLDVVAVNRLPLHFDAETLEAGLQALHQICPSGVVMSLNNRKIIDGIALAFDLEDPQKKCVQAAVDKWHKIGRAACEQMLVAGGVPAACREFWLNEALGPVSPREVRAQLAGLRFNDALAAGIDEVEMVYGLIREDLRAGLVYNPRVVRGLNYYTGTLFEGYLANVPALSICAGGRYDHLTATVGNVRLPGVGLSIGVTRLFALLKQQKVLTFGSATPSRLLVIAYSEAQRGRCRAIAHRLRADHLACEEYHDFTDKPGKQIQYATKKGIPVVLFVADEGDSLQLKNLATHEQVPVALEAVVPVMRGWGIVAKMVAGAWGGSSPAKSHLLP